MAQRSASMTRPSSAGHKPAPVDGPAAKEDASSDLHTNAVRAREVFDTLVAASLLE